MSESEFNELRELSWRRPLNAIEEARLQAYLATHPEKQASWDEEAALTHLLKELPSPPVSSNFTALVLQGLDEPAPVRAAQGWQGWLRTRFKPFLWATATALLLIAGLTGYEIHQQNERELAQQARLIVEAIPEPEAFANFDTIQKLGPVPNMDEQLWVALNQ